MRPMALDPANSNFLPIENILMASWWVFGGIKAAGSGILYFADIICKFGLTSALMAAAETIGLGRTEGGVGLVFPKFVLAPSGIIPDPPFSISQGSVPEGQGYSYS